MTFFRNSLMGTSKNLFHKSTKASFTLWHQVMSRCSFRRILRQISATEPRLCAFDLACLRRNESSRFVKQVFRSSLIFLIVSSTVSGCRHQNEDVVSTGDAIVGLALPLRLLPDTTLIRLTDFFEDPSAVSAVKIDGNPQRWSVDGEIVFAGKVLQPVVNMEVEYAGVHYDIPVFASAKVNYLFSYKASSTDLKRVFLAGTMNGWNHHATPLHLRDGDTWQVQLTLNPGLYAYRIWEDESELLDANNSDRMDNGLGGLNNFFRAGKEVGEAPILLTREGKNGRIRLKTLVPFTGLMAYYENHLIPARVHGKEVVIEIPAEAASKYRSHIRVFTHDGLQRGNDVLIPLQQGKLLSAASELRREDLHGSVMYFMMVDRFFDGDPTNNRPTRDPRILPMANNLGGDLAGITRKIREGYFSGLGVSTLWISPISRNAEGAWGLWEKGVTSTFSAYHGYWPTALRAVDDRFGTDDEFRELIAEAHEQGMNVILDYVAHHVHQDHPLYKERPDWTTSLYLPDGTMNTEKWDEHRLTTWFDTFLPTWDFSREDVVEALSDTALYWVREFDLDGFRHDATKHVREEFWRALTFKTKKELRNQPGRTVFQIGETYGSPELIASYISSGQMDAQFDFNLYDAAVDAFAKTNTDFQNLGRVLQESMHYYGHHHLMGNISGNQDRARFISYADGSVRFDEDAKLAGWTRRIQNRGPEGFRRSQMLMAFLMTAPGIPCIYYGDEIGMPGGNDPDNRRMMQFGNWNEAQVELQSFTATLSAFRRSSLPLAYGETIVIKNDEAGFAFARHYFNETVIAAFSKQPGELIVQLPDWIAAVVSPHAVSGQSIQIEARELRIHFDEPGAAVIGGL